MNFRHPAVPYVLPFAVFVALLALQTVAPISPSVRLLISLAAIAAVSLPALRSAPTRPFQSILLGVAVFFVWIGPDVLFAGWHHLVLFDNPITGHPVGMTPAAAKTDPVFLFFRIAISVVAVPILEELFWRGWLMRWLIDSKDFTRVPLGAYAPQAFWLVAALFALEHGSFWDVGFITGIVFNWWMVRTRSLWDCILMHATTNGVLAAYVVLGGHWQYWL